MHFPHCGDDPRYLFRFVIAAELIGALPIFEAFKAGEVAPIIILLNFELAFIA